MRRKTRTGICGLALGMAVISAACGSDAAADRPPLRVAVAQWPGFDLLHLAEVEGLYADRGVDVEIVDVTSLSDAHRAFSRGEVDGLAMTLAGAISLEAAGRDYRTVMLLDYSDGADVIVGAHGIGSVADLEGRVVGAEWAPLGTHMALRAFARNGLDRGETTIRYASPDELPRLLRSGLVDAIQTYPPYSSGLEDDGYQVIFSSAEIPREIVDVVAFGRDVVRDRREEIEAFVAAWPDVLERLASSESVALDLMARREGLTAEEMKAALSGVRLLTIAEQREMLTLGGAIAECRRVGRLLADAGLASSGARTSTCGLDPSIVEAIDP